jgi:hypothetical protein
MLAYDTGTVYGKRRDVIDDETAVQHVMRVCAPAWYYASQTRDDCAHAAGESMHIIVP